MDVSDLSGVGLLQSHWHVDALSAGTVNLSKLTTINSTGTTDYFDFSADGSGSTLNLSALTSLNGTGCNNSLSDTASGTILDPLLASLNGVKVTLDGTGTMAASQWTALTNSSLTVTGGTYTLSGLTDVTGSSVYVQGGGSLSLPGVTSYANPTSYDDTFFMPRERAANWMCRPLAAWACCKAPGVWMRCRPAPSICRS